MFIDKRISHFTYLYNKLQYLTYYVFHEVNGTLVNTKHQR